MTDSPYNAIAGMYHALWSNWYLPAALPALDRLFFSKIPPACRVLDVCCGSGHVTRELVRRGFRVTGADQSDELIAVARRELPDAEFAVADVCAMSFPAPFDAALSTFDSLNHILSLDQLEMAFRRIHSALHPGALFVFDMNLPEAYHLDLKQWMVDMHDNAVGMVRGRYFAEERRARTELIWFARESGDCWRRRDSIVEQHCYEREEILRAVSHAGFQEISDHAATEIGVDPDLGYGRLFVACRA